ncbi:MAG: flavodoxin-dependent (E)-4-hydroxy-3-methylbut-2-enyl-diphosphate synthase [Oscillospiraceae bacterium]
MTRRIKVGAVPIGGGAPIAVQSMLNCRTDDIPAAVRQILSLAGAGCDIVRLAVPDMESCRALSKIRERVPVPLVADIHFDYRLAVEAVAAGADKIRINPGNIGSKDRVRAVADACRVRNIPVRVGVNGGSLEPELLARYGGPTAEALCESAINNARLLQDFGCEDICVSAKASDVRTCVAAYRLLSQKTDLPLHIGLTEAGTAFSGTIRSCAAMGALLLDGIGDTIRISLTADPVEEVRAAVELLRSLGLRGGAKLVSCPTCGRTRIDMLPLAKELEARLISCPKNITVALMGCAVNGPGEAREADVGVACSTDGGLLFKKGVPLRKVPAGRIVDELMALIEKL